MKIKVLLILFLSLCIFNMSAYSFEEKRTVRVGLSNQNFSSREFQKVKITSPNIIKVVDMSQNTKIEDISANSIVEIIMTLGYYNIFINDELKYENLSGPIVFSSNADLEIIDLNRKGTPARYKGLIELRTSNNTQRFNVINVVDLENYLKGVVPNEMPISFGIEALKAQAVAAKNYVTNAKISPNYDVVDSTASQVYYGSNSYRDISSQAVVQTRGIYALYNEKPISALYYSTSAGISDNWDDVFNDGKKSDLHPYLKSKFETTTKPLNTERDVEEFYNGKYGFDTNSPKHRWSYEFTRNELEEILHNTLQQQSKAGLVEPKYDGDVKLSGLKDIKAAKRTLSGKITELLIKTDNENYTIKTQLGIRRTIKKNGTMLPSSNFFVEKIGQETNSLANEIQMEKFDTLKMYDKISLEKYPQTFKFTGGGYGHGVGMSQFGAYNLAKNGKKFPQILHFYYSDINLSTLPKNVSYNEYNIMYSSEFYFDKQAFKQAYLIINNKKGVTDFPFKINDYQFMDTKSVANDELIKMDITQYLKQGQNILSFYPLSKENKNKYITYRIEFI